MEAHPRTPNTEPLYTQITPASERPHVVMRRTDGQPHNRSARVPPQQLRPVLRPTRDAPPDRDAPPNSSGADADLDTDGNESEVVGQQPWYHVSASEFHEPLRSSVDLTHEVSDNDSSRVDPSGVSTASGAQSDEGEGGRCGGVRRESCEVREGERESVCQRGSRESVDGSLCVHTSQSGFLERTLDPGNRNPRNRNSYLGRHSSMEDTGGTVDLEEGEGEREKARDELDDLQTRLSSPQPCADPMWYRRGSGCEELGNMPAAAVETDQETGQPTAVVIATQSPQKSVTWADQEPGGRNQRHSCESYCSSLSSRSIHLEPPSASSSPHEGSPAPTLTPGYPGGPSLAMPPLSSQRPPPEVMGAVVVYPSEGHRRKSSSSSGILPPLSPTSLVSSGSSQHSGQVSAPSTRYSVHHYIPSKPT